MSGKSTSKYKSSKRRIEPSSNTSLLIILGAIIALFASIFLIIQNLLIEDDYELARKIKEDMNPLFTDLETAVKPVDGDQFSIDNIFDEPFWGTLNSGQYFGLKMSKPASLETSLMWFENRINPEGRLNIRHLCNQDDRLGSYGWLKHDFYSFGEQAIEDNGYKIMTSFAKNPSNPLEWQALINVTSNDRKLVPLSTIIYLTIDDATDSIELEKQVQRLDSEDDKEILVIKGWTNELGAYRMRISLDSSHNGFKFASFLRGIIDKNRIPVSSYMHSRMVTSYEDSSRVFYFLGSKANRYFDEAKDKKPNIIACLMNIQPPFSYTVDFSVDHSNTSHPNMKDLLSIKSNEFDREFAVKFPLNKDHSEDLSIKALDRMGKFALSNMIGSIGYFYGKSYVATEPQSHKIVPYGPIQLLTGVPSRSFFPRGFLWDEAFHNLLISRWKPDLSNSIIKSWFEIMNQNGWIPREVILGIESMRRVPQEFLIQYISNANPPAMFLAIEQMLDKNLFENSVLEHIYPRLKLWYMWFNQTQVGVKASTFRWRGRDELTVTMLNPKTLTSGLDDYPRASHPSPLEYHVDLRCWMAMVCRSLMRLAARFEDKSFLEKMTQQVNELTDQELLDSLHWSDEHRMYCDFGHNTPNVELVKVTKTRTVQPGNRLETYVAFERRSSGPHNFGCVHEFGYVSLFPMLFNLIDPYSEKLGIILNRLGDENELWSPYGIRSLSKSSRYYNAYNTEHDKPYWRGPIWINLNYLILDSLKSYSNREGPYKDLCLDLYSKLRKNVLKNVLNEFIRTNYIWEQYDDQTGKGKGSHPFTGWSSLILLIASDD